MARLKIKKVMKDKDVSQYALAKLLGKPATNVARVLASDSDPKFSTLSEIAKALKVKVSDLIEE